MEIKERISNLGTMFKGMKVDTEGQDNIIYVIINFPPKWTIYNDLEEKFGIKVKKSENYEGSNQYYFFADMETGFDAIFDSIEYNIDKMNEIQERSALLTSKIKSLKELFEDSDVTIQELRTVRIVYDRLNNEDSFTDSEDSFSEELNFSIKSKNNARS